VRGKEQIIEIVPRTKITTAQAIAPARLGGSLSLERESEMFGDTNERR